MICSHCGKDGRTHKHRLVPGRMGGEYVAGNIERLCSKCHGAADAELRRRDGVYPRSAGKRTCLVLSNQQVGYLDRLAADARDVTGVVLDRSQIVRALVDALAARGINAGKIKNEDDLRRLVA